MKKKPQVLTEVTVSLRHMYMQHVIYWPNGNHTKVWDRDFRWGVELSHDEADVACDEAIEQLGRMGLRVAEWWSAPDQIPPEWYGLAERIPGATGTWKD